LNYGLPSSFGTVSVNFLCYLSFPSCLSIATV